MIIAMGKTANMRKRLVTNYERCRACQSTILTIFISFLASLESFVTASALRFFSSADHNERWWSTWRISRFDPTIIWSKASGRILMPSRKQTVIMALFKRTDHQQTWRSTATEDRSFHTKLTRICSMRGFWNRRSKQWLARDRIFGWFRSLHKQIIGVRVLLMRAISSCTPPRSSFPAMPSTSSITRTLFRLGVHSAPPFHEKKVQTITTRFDGILSLGRNFFVNKLTRGKRGKRGGGEQFRHFFGKGSLRSCIGCIHFH